MIAVLLQWYSLSFETGKCWSIYKFTRALGYGGRAEILQNELHFLHSQYLLLAISVPNRGKNADQKKDAVGFVPCLHPLAPEAQHVSAFEEQQSDQRKETFLPLVSLNEFDAAATAERVPVTASFGTVCNLH